MDYQQTLDYLYSRLPMYQRIGKAAYKADLINTIAVCQLLGNPEKQFKSVHIAGTNGKGSTAHIIASVLQEAGLKTGLYTSPHLKDFRERIKISGKEIPEEKVIEFVDKYKLGFEKIEPSFFELTVGMAFHHFANEKVDIAVIETGLGGRLDSTNVITPLVSVITNIGYDHTQFLGNTLQLIASEKAGIIKKGIPVVIGETQEETKMVFIEIAKEKHATVFFADRHISPQDYETDLTGAYQSKNLKTALQAIELLISQGTPVKENHILKGLKNVVPNTGLSGRWQQLSKSPLTICDIGHNKEGINEVLNQIQATPHNHLHIVWGMVDDKNTEEILSLLPHNATYYFCRADIPRGLDAELLEQTGEQIGLKSNSYPSVKKALAAANSNADNDDLVFIGGSTFVVAEVL